MNCYECHSNCNMGSFRVFFFFYLNSQGVLRLPPYIYQPNSNLNSSHINIQESISSTLIYSISLTFLKNHLIVFYPKHENTNGIHACIINQHTLHIYNIIVNHLLDNGELVAWIPQNDVDLFLEKKSFQRDLILNLMLGDDLRMNYRCFRAVMGIKGVTYVLKQKVDQLWGLNYFYSVRIGSG